MGMKASPTTVCFFQFIPNPSKKGLRFSREYGILWETEREDRAGSPPKMRMGRQVRSIPGPIFPYRQHLSDEWGEFFKELV